MVWVSKTTPISSSYVVTSLSVLIIIFVWLAARQKLLHFLPGLIQASIHILLLAEFGATKKKKKKPPDFQMFFSKPDLKNCTLSTLFILAINHLWQLTIFSTRHSPLCYANFQF